MTTRDAKREACFHAALMLQANINEGWPFNVECGTAMLWGKDGEDKVVACVKELIDELLRRGVKR